MTCLHFRILKATNILEYGVKYLRIIKPFRLATEEDGETNSNTVAQDEDEIMEDDQEALDESPCPSYDLSINYDIVFSPTYQVPVLYITFQQPTDLTTTDSGNIAPTSVDAVYELLVPGSMQAQVKDVGVMGALSMTDHPISGLPAYFVHPCRTAEVMRDLFGSTDVGAPMDWTMYLLIWVGLIGGSVGLDVPAELAEHLIDGNKS